MSESESIGGEITFGGSDRSRYTGNFTFASLVGTKHWQFKLDR